MENRPKTLVLVRHGETEWNRVAQDVRSGKIQMPKHLRGVPNHRTTLSEIGRRQAIATGAGLAERYTSFDFVYQSPYIRAAETTGLVLGQFPAAARERMEARRFGSLFLVEQHPGELDPGVSGDRKDQRRRFQEYRRQVHSYGNFYLQYAGVESWSQVGLRVHLFLQMLYEEKHHEQTILVVTHGVTILLFRYMIEALSETALEEIHKSDHPRNCGVYTYTWSDSGARYRLIGSNQILY